MWICDNKQQIRHLAIFKILYITSKKKKTKPKRLKIEDNYLLILNKLQENKGAREISYRENTERDYQLLLVDGGATAAGAGRRTAIMWLRLREGENMGVRERIRRVTVIGERCVCCAVCELWLASDCEMKEKTES